MGQWCKNYFVVVVIWFEKIQRHREVKASTWIVEQEVGAMWIVKQEVGTLRPKERTLIF